MDKIYDVDIRTARKDPTKVKAPPGKFRIWKAEWEDPLALSFDRDVDSLQEAITYTNRHHMGDLVDIHVYDDQGVKKHEYLGTKQLPF